MSDQASDSDLDRALIARVVLTDDRRAFEQLVRRHQGMVRAQLRRLLRDDNARADDIAQETFLLAWRKLHQFRGEARFSTWLYRVAYSCFLQSQRKLANRALEPHSEDLDGADPPISHAEMRIDFERAMRHLSATEREVLLHCVQLELSQEETAYVLDMPLGTVKSHARRGKAKLRSILADWNERPEQEHTT